MNKLIVVIAFVIIGLLLLSTRTSAMMHVESGKVESHSDTHESLDEVLPELFTTYNKNTIQELDCEELTNEEFERVGDAVMESTHPGEAHERMDEMMGGEGSESLRQMHVQMGKRYFDCDSTNSGGSMGMMGIGGFGSMMGIKTLGHQWPLVKSGRFIGLHCVLAVITWVVFIVFLIAGTRWFLKKTGK